MLEKMAQAPHLPPMLPEAKLAAEPQAPAQTRGRFFFGWVTLALGVAHLAWCAATELRIEHVIVDVIFIGMPWIGPRAESFIRAILPVWLTGVMFDNQRFMHVVGRVHTGDMYRLDATLFPAGFTTHALSWSERLSSHPTVPLDFLCGLAYMTFIAQLLVVGVYLHVRGDKTAVASICWAVFWANLVGILAWLFIPVAPPWYILDHGFGPAMLNPEPSAAGAARFDALLHIHFFRDFYGRNPNIYGAMPSLHVAYPTIAAWYARRRGWALRAVTVIYALWMGFSAVYLAHHYVLDVVAGYTTALLSCGLADWLVLGMRSRDAARVYKAQSASN